MGIEFPVQLTPFTYKVPKESNKYTQPPSPQLPKSHTVIRLKVKRVSRMPVLAMKYLAGIKVEEGRR
jgi:hypothetical protein